MPPPTSSPPQSSIPSASSLGSDGQASIDSKNATRGQRNRATLSCSNCRTAKLKCDRKEPCSQCIKKGKASSCSIPRPTARRKPVGSLQNRLKHLEGLVKDAMAGKHSGENQNADTSQKDLNLRGSTRKDASEALTGQVLLDNNETTYVGATHWAAILEDIEEVKAYFNEEVKDEEIEEEAWPTAALSFDIESPATKLDLLNALPSRIVVDQWLSKYFNSNSPTLHIIHVPAFQKEYQQFWENQNETPTAWLSVLYAMLAIATCVAIGAGEGSLDDRGSPPEMIRSYRQCCVQALVLSHYTKPGPYTLEAFMIYLEGEFLLSRVDQVQCYLLLGTAVRLALRMGLHRDPSKIGGQITPYQAEMRRRLWHHLKQIDLLGAFHIGLPSAMQGIDSDTQLPSNYRDEDLDEHMTEIPAPRPESERTPISYMVCKSRICDIACKVATLANLLSLPSYAEVMRLDSQLSEAHSHLPHFFQLPSSGFYITDKPELIVKRISLELLFQKSRCMLHRKFLIKAAEDFRYTFSKEAGLDSALQLLRIQALAHEACLPGGLLHRDRWFQSTLSMHDFLLAAMIVYLSVSQDIGGPGGTSGSTGDTPEQHNCVAALEKSYQIWIQNTNHSLEARRAAAVLKIMLTKINSASARTSDIGSNIAMDSTDTAKNHASNLLSMNLETNLSIDGDTSGNSSSMLSSAPSIFDENYSDQFLVDGGRLPSNIDPLFLPMESWETMAAMPKDFDWEVFDNQIRPQQAADHTWPEFTSEDYAIPSEESYNYSLT